MAIPLAPKILVVEDEPSQRELLNYNLQKEGYDVSLAEDGEEGVLCALEGQPDLIVLDWMLPHLSGIEVCRQLKKRQQTAAIPVIMLTARSEEADRIRGLDTGADDYVVKPYSVSELMARIRALLRRTRPAAVGQVIEIADLTLDASAHRVSRAGRVITMGPTEYRLLAAFMERPGQVWTRQLLLDRVWGQDSDVDLRTVDVHVGRLRKLLCHGGEKDLIRTIRGTGYSLERDAS